MGYHTNFKTWYIDLQKGHAASVKPVCHCQLTTPKFMKLLESCIVQKIFSTWSSYSIPIDANLKLTIKNSKVLRNIATLGWFSAVIISLKPICNQF